jgi:hypothetical protein
LKDNRGSRVAREPPGTRFRAIWENPIDSAIRFFALRELVHFVGTSDIVLMKRYYFDDKRPGEAIACSRRSRPFPIQTGWARPRPGKAPNQQLVLFGTGGPSRDTNECGGKPQ